MCSRAFNAETSFRTKKIIHVIGQMGRGGAEIFVKNISIEMSYKYNASVTVVLLSSCLPELKRVLLENDVQVREVSFSKYLFVNAFFAGFLLMKEVKVALVFSHLFPAILTVNMFRMFGGKAFHVEHSTTNRRRRSLFLKLIDSLFYLKLNIIAVSSEVMNSFPRTHKILLGKDSRVISNAVPPLVRSERELYRKKFVIGCVGAIRKEKNYEFLLGLAQIIGDDVLIMVAGSDASDFSKYGLDYYRKSVEGFNLHRRLLFLGAVDDMEQFYNNIDILLNCSLHEAAPLSFLEASSIGIPILYSNNKGSRSFLGDYGIPFSTSDKNVCCDLIFRFKNDPSFYSKFERLSHQFYLNNSFDMCVREYMKIVED